MSGVPALSLLCATSLGACSLLVDVGGLSEPGAADGATDGRDGAVVDAAIGDAGAVGTTPADGAASDDGGIALVDTFDRADGRLGNGWVEKSAGSLMIAGQKVVVGNSIATYRDAIVRRPPSEDLADAEVSIDCVVSSFSGVHPQVHARVQATVVQPGVLDSYLLFVPRSPDQALLARAHGSNEPTTLASIALSPPLEVGVRFRLRLRVSGVAPVKLEAFVERVVDGSPPSMLGQAVRFDNAPERIDPPGSVGFSWENGRTFAYDDFRRTPL